MQVLTLVGAFGMIFTMFGFDDCVYMYIPGGICIWEIQIDRLCVYVFCGGKRK